MYKEARSDGNVILDDPAPEPSEFRSLNTITIHELDVFTTSSEDALFLSSALLISCSATY
jgi:hypothetical protein